MRRRLTFANVVSSVAVFVALSGTGFAAGVLPARSVGTAQLKASAVSSAKVKDGSLKAADIAAGELPAGARGGRGAQGPAGPAGNVDVSLFATRAEADGRWMRGALVTVVVQSDPISFADSGTAVASCPAGYQAISGGVDMQNTTEMTIIGSGPVVEGVLFTQLADGQHGAPTAWEALVKSLSAPPLRFKVAVDCAPLG
jgi:hypothetical protein